MNLMKRLMATVTITAALAGNCLSQSEANPGHLKMGLVNIKALYSDSPDPEANKANIQSNLDRHAYFIDKLAADGVEFIAFPECSINGYRWSANMTWLSMDGPEVEQLKKKAIEKGVYVAAGMAEQDAAGKKWEVHFVIGPDGKIVGKQRKNWLTKEKGFIESGTEQDVFDVKGTRMGIVICADGTDFNNLKTLAGRGAKIIYGAHANTTGGSIAGWYNFRKAWGGTWDGTSVELKREDAIGQNPSGGWISTLKIHAALHNHAALYNPHFDPLVPSELDTNTRWASGAWFIGPDGETLAQMPTSMDPKDSREFVLTHNVPLGGN